MTNFKKIFFITSLLFVLFLPYAADAAYYCKSGGCTKPNWWSPMECTRTTCISGNTCYYRPSGCLPPTYSSCVYKNRDTSKENCSNACVGNKWYYNSSDICTSGGWDCSDPSSQTCSSSGCCNATCNKSTGCGLNPGTCADNSCSKTYNDSCMAKELKDYNNDSVKNSITVTSSCSNTCRDNCSCTSCTTDCSAPIPGKHCVAGVCGAACDSNSDCSSDGWYDVGSSYSCCSGTKECSCQDQEERDYSCKSDCSCGYDVTDTRTQKTSCDCAEGSCGAACDSNSDCSCPSDGCVGYDYYNYPNNGDCSSSCNCQTGTGSGKPCEPTITYNKLSCGCNLNRSNDFTVDFGCVLDGVHYLQNGNLTITTGGSLQMNADSSLEFDSGYKIEIEGDGYILKSANGTEIRKQ